MGAVTNTAGQAVGGLGQAVDGTMGFFGGGSGAPGTGGILNTTLSGGNTPQQQGYGISGPSQFEPYQSSPGLQSFSADPHEGFRFGPQQPGGGDLVRAPQGFDQTSPGQGEQYFNNQQERFQSGGAGADFYGSTQDNYAQPGAGEQYWNSLSGKNAPQMGEGVFRSAQGDFAGPSNTESFARTALPQVAGPSQAESYYGQAMGQLQGAANPRNAQDAYDAFVSSQDAGLDPYYDRASDKLVQRNNRALAAQGMLGSAFGANNTAEGLAALGAEQANREGDFMMQQAALRGQLAQGADQGGLEGVRLGGQLAQGASNAELGRLGLGGNLAGNIDQNRLAQYGLLGNMGMGLDSQDLARDMGYGNLAMGAQTAGLGRTAAGQQTAMGLDQLDLQKVLAGQQAATTAQSMQQGRAQSMLDNIFRQQQAGTTMASPYYQGAIDTDQSLMDSTMAAEMGLAQQALNQGYRGQERIKEDVSWAADTAGKGASLFGGK